MKIHTVEIEFPFLVEAEGLYPKLCDAINNHLANVASSLPVDMGDMNVIIRLVQEPNNDPEST